MESCNSGYRKNAAYDLLHLSATPSFTEAIRRMLSKCRSYGCILLTLAASLMPVVCRAQVSGAAQVVRQKVIIDTDIGDDIDDVFAVGLALSSQEFEIVGITSAWGDTQLRARLLDRLLRETGRSNIPVAVGIEKTKRGAGAFSQRHWAEREPATPHRDAVEFMLEQIRKAPGQITLISLAPTTNLGAAIERDAATFRKLKRVVMMGGSVRAGYGDLGYAPDRGPDAEYNIAMDPQAAQKLFGIGVPLYVMPLDSTQIKLNADQRVLLFTESTPLTDAFALLYDQWAFVTKNQTPTMFDAVAVGYALDPKLCPTQPMRLQVDDKGYTRVETGPANAQVCMKSAPDRFFSLYMPRLLTQRLSGSRVICGR